MNIVLFFIVQWYLGLLIQSVFLHRYAAHNNFAMNGFWEKCFFMMTFLVFGSSYMSAYAFGAMHRLHHAHSDQKLDPHSPLRSPGFFATIWQTRNSYYDIFIGKTRLEAVTRKGLPQWDRFDKFAHSWYTRSVWVVLYIFMYVLLATAWWQYLFLPITIALGAIQGGLVNWWAHTFGYRNFDTADNSKNMLPIDLFFWGESYHNNHHKHPWKLNHASKWFEWDSGYYFILFLRAMGIVKVSKRAMI